LLILIAWESAWLKKFLWARLIPGALVAVIWGIAFNQFATVFFPEFSIHGEHLVRLPVTTSPEQLFAQLSFPDFNFLADAKVYTIAFTLAIIASLETLLSLEAVDKLDPLKRTAPTNRELKAQGMGNIISGLLGGVPITAVIVRSSANINAGGQTRVSCFVHGLFLLLSIVFFANTLNLIPLACLAAILLQTGYKLAKPKMFIDFYKQGLNQFIPFAATIIAILITDLLKGIVIGIAIGLYFVIRANYQASITMSKEGNHYTLSLNKDVSFLNKALLRKILLQIEENSSVTINATKATFIDHDILETLEDFLKASPDDNIHVEVIDVKGKQYIKSIWAQV
jgi:MFS superfamily sulfate permease-like transporter